MIARGLAMVLALVLTGLQLQPPATGVVVELERVDGWSSYRYARGCKSTHWQRCEPHAVDHQPTKYVVRYRWAVGPLSDVRACHVSADAFYQTSVGDAFTCIR